MARETDLTTSDGLTLYQTIRRLSDGQYWNGAAFEAFNAAHWATYALALAKSVILTNVAAVYSRNFPALVAGQYHVEIYRQAAGTPALTDGPPGWEYAINWDGMQEGVTLAATDTTATNTAALVMMTTGSGTSRALTTLATIRNVTVTP